MSKGTNCKYREQLGCDISSCPGTTFCESYNKLTRKEYNKAHPRAGQVHTERDRVQSVVLMHKQRGMKVEVTTDEAMEVLAKTNGVCRYCGRVMVRGKGKLHDLSPSLDRINNEQVLTKDNIQFICKQCNTTKGDRPHNEFIAYLRYIVEHNKK